LRLTGIWAILSHTFVESIKAKWLLTFAAVFFFLAMNVPTIILYIEGVLPPDYFLSFLPALVTLAFPFIPLLALPMGATSIVDERESGRLQYILSHPLSKSEFLFGRTVGLLFATSTVIVSGFGIASVLTYGTNFRAYWSVTLTILVALTLNAAMLGLSLFISIISKKRVTALAIAILMWFALTVGTYFGLLSFVINLAQGRLFVLPFILLNPVETTNILAAMTNGQQIEQLGTSGLILVHYLGQAARNILISTTVAWIFAFFIAGFLWFRHQDAL